MNKSDLQGLENELQSSRHLHLQQASRKRVDIATVPVRAGTVQFKKSIAGILRSETH